MSSSSCAIGKEITAPYAPESFFPRLRQLEASVKSTAEAFFTNQQLLAKLFRKNALVLTMLQSDPRSGAFLGKSLVVMETNEMLQALATICFQTVQLHDPVKLQGKFKGCGGNYLLQTASKKVAIFKPIDEEPHATNNVKPFEMWEGVKPGEGAVNECATFLLDHEGFYGVLPTTIVLLRSAVFDQTDHFPSSQPAYKVGSAQEWLHESHCRWDELSSKEIGALPAVEIQKIAILDMRILNHDRNEENILVAKDRLIPIDHGPVFCDTLREKFNWCWMDTAQARQKCCPEIKKQLKSIDFYHDAALLRKELGMRRKALFCMMTATLFLQIASERDLTPFEMGQFVGADGFSPSINPLHVLSQQAIAEVQSANNNNATLLPYEDQELLEKYFSALSISIHKAILEQHTNSCR